MYKKVYTLLFATLLFAACKKEKKVQPQLPDVSGIWVLNSSSISNVNYNASEYPCLTGNTFSINSNGTTKSYYTGNTTCFLNNLGQNVGLAIGVPGQDTVFGTWSSNADVFIYKNAANAENSYGTVSTVNGRQQLSVTDTAYYLTNGGIITTAVYLKQ